MRTKYLAVVERAARNYSAYLPDVPGCVATGRTKAACLANLREALAMHLHGVVQDGMDLPRPCAEARLMSV
ncbi:MAG: type II toxin-antitoxin system HicB family antitoxin [Planctomycetes bacterium]|nr:type II toxin-antitoxin system HicB family antitoxin [Planctomycetota bacterium]